MSQEGSASDVKDYIRDKIRSGKFLIKSIHQRQQTISNIAVEIVKRQDGFMSAGPSALGPADMKPSCRFTISTAMFEMVCCR